MESVVYDDGTEVPGSVANHLSTINEGHHVVIVYKDGRQYGGNTRSDLTPMAPMDVRWMIGGRPLMDVFYTPFKVVVRDKDILSLVNFASYDYHYSD